MRTSLKGRLVPLVLLAPVVAALAVLMGNSAAASCRSMAVGYSVSGGGLVVLTPSHVDIAYGGCVSFANQTAATATVTVGGHYSQQVAPNSSTSGNRNYVGTTPGRQSVTATTTGSTAQGSITVGAPASPSPAPRHSRAPTPTPTPVPVTPSPRSSGTGPQVAPTPRHHSHSPSPGPGGVIQPPVSPPGPIQLTPSGAPSPAPTAVIAGPIEPASGRGVGLPAAVAALAVVGTGAALIRVLAAEPVDSRETVGGSS